VQEDLLCRQEPGDKAGERQEKAEREKAEKEEQTDEQS
jgi:hypothetical protein